MSPRIKEFINRGVMPLVGRERELRALLDAFGSLLDGEPRAVWMNGAAGAGKSRLLDELKARGRDHAARSLVVHAKWYEGEAVELGPLSNALEVLRPALTAPVAARLYRDGSITTVDAAVEAVQIASRRYPVVLILDDLHYLRSSSELERFISALEEIPILLVTTTRPVENPVLRSLRSALAGSIPPLELEIGPLDGAGIAEAALSLFGSEPPAEMLGQIAALSAGLPLSLREVFRELMAEDHIMPGDRDDNVWEWRSAALADETLRAIGDKVHGFSGRLASLAVPELRILVMAAHLGEQFNRDLLRQLCERTVGWDHNAFERLILGGFISVAVPSVRLGTREPEGRACYAFMHTLLWKATAAATVDGIPAKEEIASIAIEILTGGTGELYNVAPLEGLAVEKFDDVTLRRLYAWLVAVAAKLSPIYSETYVALCRAVLEPCRVIQGSTRHEGEMLEAYLAALTAYGERLYLTGAREPLQSVATEIAEILERLSAKAPASVEERITRLEAAVVIWHDALLRGVQDLNRSLLDSLLASLPEPVEQSDRELRGAAEAIRLLASYSFGRGDFAQMLDIATPYISELDRMRPETLNALMKVLLYAMMNAGRLDEAGEMVAAGLRLRREADLFTEYELLMHAANYARRVRDLAGLRRHASEARELLDRYPAYRNQSTNYWHLPYVAACDGDLAELTKLEERFRSTPPPARSSPEQILIAHHQFLLAWNLLGVPSHALPFLETLRSRAEKLSPIQRLQITMEELRSHIDARNVDIIPEIVEQIETQRPKLGAVYATPESGAARRLSALLTIANSVALEEPDALCGYIAELEAEDIEDMDALRAAEVLLKAAERSNGRKREFNDAAYRAIEFGLQKAREEASIGLACHRLDQLGDLLPKTRLSRFRQQLGDDPRSEPSAWQESQSDGDDRTVSRMLRTFGALRIEGVDEAGAKLESKTRTLVAALVVSKLGDARLIGELTRDHLADLLWPDMSLDRAVNNLHATLSYARRFLGGSDTVIQRDGVYELGDDVVIDVVEFRDCINKGDRLHGEGIYFGAAVAYRNAIALAQGDFLEGMYAEWVDNVRESLRSELATALERLIAIELDRDNYAAVPPLAERLLALDDLHDGAYEALIRSAASRGARREAFGYFKRYETALDSYGAGPARRITELMTKVRAGDA